jgi:uncharacterized protein YbjT (DUF2867 family)
MRPKLEATATRRDTLLLPSRQPGPVRLTPDVDDEVDDEVDDAPIVLLGAGGKTGRAVTAALSHRGLHHRVRRIVRPGTTLAGEWAGDLTRDADVAAAVAGAAVVHVVVPNLHPEETGIVRRVIRAAREGGTRRLVYHSVLRPGIRAMPHHWAKLEAEELLWSSGLEVTVLQPSAYTQNLVACCRGDRLGVPYSVDVPFSFVDLTDVADATARVLSEPVAHAGACYELAGPVSTVRGVATELGLGAEREPVPAMEDGYAARSLRAMFAWYDRHGLPGNPAVLQWLIGRPATDPAALLRPLLVRR